MVGEPVADVPTRPMPDDLSILTVWSPMLCERADGSRYGVHLYYQRHTLGSFRRLELQGGIEHPDGRREHFVAVEPDLAFDDVNRRLRGGTLHCTMPDGEVRPIEVQPISETGFHARRRVVLRVRRALARAVARPASTSTASTSPTSRRPSRPDASTSSATA